MKTGDKVKVTSPDYSTNDIERGAEGVIVNKISGSSLVRFEKYGLFWFADNQIEAV